MKQKLLTASEMLVAMAKLLRDSAMQIEYWRDYAFRLEAELGQALHLRKPKRGAERPDS